MVNVFTTLEKMDQKPSTKSLNRDDDHHRQTKRPRKTDVNDDDEEALLAAALGTSNRVENMDAYEDSVIRNAELSSTPRLMMPAVASAADNNDHNDSVVFGFPPLHTLTPSRNVHADLAHVQTVLQRLRRNGLTSEKDFLKEQLLLALLHAATDDKEMSVRPRVCPTSTGTHTATTVS